MWKQKQVPASAVPQVEPPLANGSGYVSFNKPILATTNRSLSVVDEKNPDAISPLTDDDEETPQDPLQVQDQDQDQDQIIAVEQVQIEEQKPQAPPRKIPVSAQESSAQDAAADHPVSAETTETDEDQWTALPTPSSPP